MVVLYNTPHVFTETCHAAGRGFAKWRIETRRIHAEKRCMMIQMEHDRRWSLTTVSRKRGAL
jgi:hypothetical protein